jgi:trigger factor
LNIQTEHLEQHKAQITVEIEVERLDKAKVTAARKISKRVNIPGFRKGKAPYKILVNYVGEAAILEEAVDVLGNEIYKEALDASELAPYGPGEFADFKLEPNPTFVFTVPLQPTVELNDYRSVRLEYEAPVIEDYVVDQAMKMMQEQDALVEESQKPVEIGNRVTIDVHAFLIDEAGKDESDAESTDEKPAHDEAGESAEADSDEHDEHDDHHHHDHDADNVFMHNHDLQIRLDEDDEPVLPGFSAAIVGATVDESREFELTVPDLDDYEDDIRGRRVEFHVTIKKIESLTLPALNDEYAARITESEEKPLTLLELRIRVRENLEQEAERRAKSEYNGRVLDMMVEQATIAYPEELVKEQTEEMLKDLDGRLRQQGLTLDAYLKVMNKTQEDLYADYREPAVRSVERQLVMLEVLRAEGLKATIEAVNERIDEMIASFGERADEVRSLFDTPQMRMNIENDLLQKSLMERISDIAQGKEIVETADAESDAEDQPLAEPETEVSAEPDEAEAVVDEVAPASDEAEAEDEG